MRRALALATGLLVILALVLPAGAQTREETLIYSLQSDVDNWDPPNSVLREAIILGYHVYDHLAVRDVKTRRVVPHLATSWTNIDDTTWEVKLRQGVKFHDGTPFTSRDVKATFDRVLDPTKKMTARGNHAKIKGVDIIDDHTVRFRTDGPYPLFVERLTAQVMQSDKVIREKGHEAAVNYGRLQHKAEIATTQGKEFFTAFVISGPSWFSMPQNTRPIWTYSRGVCCSSGTAPLTKRTWLFRRRTQWASQPWPVSAKPTRRCG